MLRLGKLREQLLPFPRRQLRLRKMRGLDLFDFSPVVLVDRRQLLLVFLSDGMDALLVTRVARIEGLPVFFKRFGEFYEHRFFFLVQPLTLATKLLELAFVIGTEDRDRLFALASSGLHGFATGLRRRFGLLLMRGLQGFGFRLLAGTHFRNGLPVAFARLRELRENVFLFLCERLPQPGRFLEILPLSGAE